MTTIEELRERVEVFGPFTQTIEIIDDDGEPTGETADIVVLAAEVVHDGMLYIRKIEMSPRVFPEIIDIARNRLIDAVAHYALNPTEYTSGPPGSDATGGIDLAAQVRTA